MNHPTISSLFLGTALLLGACGSDSPDRSAKTVDVRLAEYSIVMPDTISGPTVALSITNDGTKAHELGIAQLKPGTTLDEAIAFVDAGGQEGAVLVDDPGGTGIIGAGAMLGYDRDLAPGTYVLFCSLPAPDQMNHAQHGMVKLFTVGDGNDSNLPKADLTILLQDDTISVPALTAGTHMIAITNSGTGPHELSIGGLPKDVDLSRGAEIGEWIGSGQDGPAPVDVDFPGGVKSIQPGVTVVLTVTFKTGHTYLFSDNSTGEELSTVVEVP